LARNHFAGPQPPLGPLARAVLDGVHQGGAPRCYHIRACIKAV
jgi:hypothetical protein